LRARHNGRCEHEYDNAENSSLHQISSATLSFLFLGIEANRWALFFQNLGNCHGAAIVERIL
jgi:hypothetical protein